MEVTLAESLGTLALMGACATIAGAAEDLESDFGSQSNANSQVQLAPQVGYLHRVYNKAICGEPVAYGLLSASGAAIALALNVAFSINIVIALALGAATAALMYGVYATTAYMGRLTGQKRFGQPIYIDVLLTTTPPIIAHAFIATMGIATFSYLLNVIIGQPFPFPILALLWGVMTGGMGSAVGDVHYGAERQYQYKPFGMGLPAAQSGKIVQKGEVGLQEQHRHRRLLCEARRPAHGTRPWPDGLRRPVEAHHLHRIPERVGRNGRRPADRRRMGDRQQDHGDMGS